MNYLILVETEFFALINGAGNGDMGTAYNGFVESVISLCYGKGNHADAAIALAYAENELQHHHSLYDDSKDRKSMFVRKALSFIRKMRKHAASSYIRQQNNRKPGIAPAMDGQRHRPCGTYLRHQRNGLYQQRQYAAQTACPTPVQDIRRGIKGLLPFLHRHQTSEEREPHLFP